MGRPTTRKPESRLGILLRESRLKAGLNLGEAADKLKEAGYSVRGYPGMSLSGNGCTVGQWELGDAHPNPENLLIISEIFGIPLAKLKAAYIESFLAFKMRKKKI